MKIEVIRKESKPVEETLHVGGVYRLDSMYVILAASESNSRDASDDAIFNVVSLSSGVEVNDLNDESGWYRKDIVAAIADGTLVYVPNARLVIEE